jgi:hypothetical protein
MAGMCSLKAVGSNSIAASPSNWRRAEESNLHPYGALVFETSKRCRRLAPSVGAPPRNRTASHRVAAGALAIGLRCVALRGGFEPPVTALETVSLTIGNRSMVRAAGAAARMFGGRGEGRTLMPEGAGF